MPPCLPPFLVALIDTHILYQSSAAHPQHVEYAAATNQPKHARRCVLKLLVVEKGSPVPLRTLSKGAIEEKLERVVLRTSKRIVGGVGLVDGQRRWLHLASWANGLSDSVVECGYGRLYRLRGCLPNLVRPLISILIISLISPWNPAPLREYVFFILH